MPCDGVPSFMSVAGNTLSMDCGSSWEVDLRSDADCDQPGTERCHPRFTLGWKNNEVQLYRGAQSVPRHEYVHAYCDVWRRGRLENVMLTPLEQGPAREAATTRRVQLGEVVDAASPASLHVLVLLMRGMSTYRSNVGLPKTLRFLHKLHGSGEYRLASFDQHRAVGTDGHQALTMLQYGFAQSTETSPWSNSTPRSLWDAYRSRGYVSAFAESGCGTAGSKGLGFDLER